MGKQDQKSRGWRIVDFEWLRNPPEWLSATVYVLAALLLASVIYMTWLGLLAFTKLDHETIAYVVTAIAYVVAVVVCVVSAGFVGSVIWQRAEAPAAAFWTFAILASVPTVVLSIVPVIVDRIGNIKRITKEGDRTTIEWEDRLVSAERRAIISGERTFQLEQEFVAAGKLVPPPPTSSGWQLEQVGFGDCPGQDIAATEGAQPAKEQCTKATAGMSAVCWDGMVFVNRSNFRGGPWCTYKDIPPSRCVGGAAPGRLYKCVPPGS